jgi:hypothetical protein
VNEYAEPDQKLVERAPVRGFSVDRTVKPEPVVAHMLVSASSKPGLSR